MNQPTLILEDPRNRLAAERTLLAWIRTGLAMMGFGFVVARFGLFLREIAAAGNLPRPAHTGFSLWIGTILVLAGVTVSLLAAWEYQRFVHHLEQQTPYQPTRWPLGILAAAFLAIMGIVMALYLILLAA